jgi:hypothetical protein
MGFAAPCRCEKPLVFAPYPECQRCGHGPELAVPKSTTQLALALVPYVFHEQFGHLQKTTEYRNNGSNNHKMWRNKKV